MTRRISLEDDSDWYKKHYRQSVFARHSGEPVSGVVDENAEYHAKFILGKTAFRKLANVETLNGKFRIESFCKRYITYVRPLLEHVVPIFNMYKAQNQTEKV